MKRKRYSGEQIAFALRQHEAGTSVPDILRELGISEQTFYQWKKKLADQARPSSSHSKSSRSAFRTVEVTSPCQAATTIRLGNGIEIELGDDLRVVQAVVKQLLELSSGATLAAGGR